MRKIIMYGILMLFVIGTFCGCGDMLTTKEYRQMKSLYQKIEDGRIYTKEDIYDRELGCPEGYYDESGKYQQIPYEEREAAADTIYKDGVEVWIYTCFEFSDPANPYRLKLTFDSKGNVTQAEFELIPGG